MKSIDNSKRAVITAILCRAISELAGNNPGTDPAVTRTVRDVIRLCYGATNDDTINDALIVTSQSDWLFTISKIEQAFTIKAELGLIRPSEFFSGVN